MGQLDIYAIIDIFALAFFGSFLSGYFSTEVNGSVEQIVPYKYSAQFMKKNKKKYKIFGVVTDKRDAAHFTWVVADLAGIEEYDIYKSINERVTWFDPFVAGWEGANERNKLEKLEVKYDWE